VACGHARLQVVGGAPAAPAQRGACSLQVGGSPAADVASLQGFHPHAFEFAGAWRLHQIAAVLPEMSPHRRPSEGVGTLRAVQRVHCHAQLLPLLQIRQGQ